MSPPQAGPTPRQTEYLAFVRQYTRLIGLPPTEADVAAFFGVSSPSAHLMLRRLEERGFVDRAPFRGSRLRSVSREVGPLPVLGWRDGAPHWSRGDDTAALAEFVDFLGRRIVERRQVVPLAKLGQLLSLALSAQEALKRLGATPRRIENVVASLRRLAEMDAPRPAPASVPIDGPAKTPSRREEKTRARPETDPGQLDLF